MKKYIILMLNIHRMGGTQTYIASKVKYLRNNGWDVYVFYGDMKNNKCAVPQLLEFNDNSIAGLTTPPNYLLPSIRQQVLKEIISIVGIDDYSEIIVETLTGILSLWGELVAEALSAKHICFLCDENFRQPGQVYIEHLNFFDFKHQRRELAGIHDNSLVKLFDGYKNIPLEERYTLVAYEGEVVQDVKNEIVEHIERCDWNICYIGRMDKGYVDNIVNDMAQLALKYKDKNIQIIFVGNDDKKKKYINKLYQNIINVKLIFLGNLVPIPRILYSKSDVIIAGAGCAYSSAYEGKPVVIPDARNFLANGVYGYDTFNSLYNEENTEQMRFDRIIEKILIDDAYIGKKIQLPEKSTAKDCYNKHFEFIENSNDEKCYYTDFNKQRIRVIAVKSIRYYIKKYFPWTVKVKWLLFRKYK